MFCKMGLTWNRKLQCWLIIAGLLTMASGLALTVGMKGAGYSQGMFCGMLTGLGAASALLGAFHLYKIKKLSPEELTRKIRQSNDERNQAIVGRAMEVTVTVVCGSVLVAALIAALLNHAEITFALVAVIYLTLLTFAAACRQFEKTM